MAGKAKFFVVFLFLVTTVALAYSGDEYSGSGHRNNPFVFQDRHFTARLETELGSVRVLQKFTDRSELFRGIEKFRVGFLEAEPQSFVIPNHWDAEALLFVVNGEATISMINEKSRQSFNIKRGDIFRVPAGISVYLINKSNNQKLVLAKIIRSISVAPGDLQTFFGAGVSNQESSFLNAFSPEILEAAFNANSGELQRILFAPQKQQGIFKKATQEQIKSFSNDEGNWIWPFGGKNSPYNIFDKNPTIQNENGNLRDVNPEDLTDLRNINVAFSLFNISQGSIAGPFYNTKTTILVVPNGEGQFEMACPHLPEQSRGGSFGGDQSRGGGFGGDQSRGGGFSGDQSHGGSFGGGVTYEKVSSRLRRGTVVVVPAGHPIVIEASSNRNLEVIGFGVNTDENQWITLAGRDNVMSRWEDGAVELTFGSPARVVKKVIEKQNKKLFFKGPNVKGEGWRAFV